MLRILQTSDASVTTLSLQGKLLAPWASEVRLTAANALSHGPVRIDLAELTFADSEGVAALRSLRNAGIQLVRASDFIEDLLAMAGPTAR